MQPEPTRERRAAATVVIISCFIYWASPWTAEWCEGADRRADFVKAISHVLQGGMSQGEVVGALGEPDQIQFETKYDGSRHEIWRYGPTADPAVVTLGEVWFDAQRRVDLVVGEGTAPPEGLFQEKELVGLCIAMNRVLSYRDQVNYNPRPLIRAVNLLREQGKNKALAAIEEFVRVARPDRRLAVFLILRTLFDVPADPGYLPSLTGPLDPAGPRDPRVGPRFPIMIEDDIPFLVSPVILGVVTPVSYRRHIGYFRDHGTLRSKPLYPSAAPFRSAEELMDRASWYFGKKDTADSGQAYRRHFLDNQVMRLLNTVHRVDNNDGWGSLAPFEQVDERRRRVAELSRLAIRWDSARGEYTFLDGTTLPPEKRNIHVKHLWKQSLQDVRVELAVERLDHKSVAIGLWEEWKTTHTRTSAVVKVFDPRAKEKVFCEFRLEWSPGTIHAGVNEIGRSSGEVVRLDEGGKVQAELSTLHETWTSPVFNP